MYSIGTYAPAAPEQGERNAHPPPREPGDGFYYAPTAPAFGPPSSASPHYGFRRNGSTRSTSEQTRNSRKQGSSESRRQVRENLGDTNTRPESPQARVEVGSSSADRSQGRGPYQGSNADGDNAGSADAQRSSSAPPSPSRLSAWTSAGVLPGGADYGNSTNVPRRKAGDTSASSSYDLEAAYAGLMISHEQSDRYSAFMNGSPFTHRQAQAKVLELIQFWLSSPETGAQIDGAIREVVYEAQKSKAAMGQVVQAWGGDSPGSNMVNEKADGGEKKRSQQKPRPSLEPQLIELEDGSPTTAEKGTRKSDKPRRKSDSTVSVASSASSRHGANAPLTAAEGEPSTSGKGSSRPAAAGAEPGDDQTVATSPHAPLESLPSGDNSASQSTSFRRRYDNNDDTKADRPGSSGEEVAKEPPPEKRRKEPKPPPEKTAGPESPQVGQVDAKATPGLPEVSPTSATNSSTRPQSARPQSARPQTDELPASLSRRPSPQPSATFEEIPRFYFPLGRQTLQQEVLTGPLSKKIENPHLKMVDGVALPTTILDGERDRSNASLPGSSPDELRQPPNSKSCPVSSLRCVDDAHVGQYIQREFSRLPPAPKLDVKSRVRSGGRFRGSNGTPLAKQEAAYRQQVILCLQRICVQCFGLPRYFSFIVMRLIQREIVEGLSQTSSFRLSRSPTNPGGSATPDIVNTKAETSATTLITAQHLKDFYTAHLRGKDSRRRIFDILILSASLPRAEESAVPKSAVVDTNKQRNYLMANDFIAYLEALLQHHPGLSFLRETPDFQSKYVETVVYRIFYEIDRFDRGRISYAEFVNSRLTDAFRQVDATDDINTVLLFFSYEHFYVLYCRFWELNETRNMQLSKEDLARYAPEDTMNPVIIDRIFAGLGRPVRCPVKDHIGYEDFVWFCLSEEDKSTPTAIRYWFRILDMDGDGVLSLYELQTFYDATRNKIAEYVIDNVIVFNDVACQVFDMLRVPAYRPLTLRDFLREPEAAHVALSMLTNVVKFLQFEQRDPFVAHQDRLLGGLEQSRWDRFARIEYDRMAQEADE